MPTSPATRRRSPSASTTSTPRRSARRSRASPRTNTRRRRSSASPPAPASPASPSTASKRSGVISRRAPLPNPLPAARGEGIRSVPPLPLAGEGRGEGKPLWIALAVLLAAASCAHKAKQPRGAANPIAPAALPKTNAEAQATFDDGVRLKKAASVYAKWLDADPNDFDMRARYGQVLREAGALDESLEQARLLLGTAGENVSHTVIAYNALALTYYKMGKYELAETALKKASDLDPKSAFVWNNLGLVAFERGHDQEAFLDFQKASELDPKYVQARLNKAVVYLDCGDYKKARGELERAVEIDPNDAEAQVALGVAARGDGKLDQARKAYERAIDIEPDYPPALYNLGVLYMDFDKVPEKAKDFLTQYTQAVGNDDPKRADAVSRLKELK